MSTVEARAGAEIVTGGPGGPAGPGAARAAVPRDAGRRVRGNTWRLLGSEVGLTFRRPRNLVMLAVLALVPAVIGVVLRTVSAGGAEGDAGAIIGAVAGNGMLLAFVSLFVLVPLLLPVAVAVVAGDAIAGEASLGTLRYLLAAPAGRTRLLAVKYVNAVVFGLAATAVVAASALVTGFALFPIGPVTLLSGSTIPVAEGMLRVLIAVAYVGAGMAALSALALAVSTLTEAPIGAIAGTVVFVILTQVLSTIPQLAVIEPYLLTSYLPRFDGALRDPVATEEMTRGLLAFAAHIAVCGSFAWARFHSRDVTS
ncbi:ABC transporter permease [Microtetraspora sp. NBRC 13810]|uniref:ABC transporter permease subunit n=1 Tax=Microtetraspora sp. NBRC 13810 TaxID=3030990 RepID=UPI0024A09E61|nr:ABC transporter permease subunit [Microtetraspora sp. NBRC 13810]GLW09318.1 ABC transporter permease [Microtetraspora sp. NBRC 13810]